MCTIPPILFWRKKHSGLIDTSDLKAVKCFINMKKGKRILFFSSLHYGPLLSFFPSFLNSFYAAWQSSVAQCRREPRQGRQFCPIFITKHKFYTDFLSTGSLTHFPAPCSIRFSFFFLLLFIYGVFKGNENWEV